MLVAAAPLLFTSALLARRRLPNFSLPELFVWCWVLVFGFRVSLTCAISVSCPDSPWVFEGRLSLFCCGRCSCFVFVVFVMTATFLLLWLFRLGISKTVSSVVVSTNIYQRVACVALASSVYQKKCVFIIVIVFVSWRVSFVCFCVFVDLG